jgi:threonine synthase
MYYLSTRNNKLRESFTNILFQGLSKDGGLFLPEKWPSLDVNTLRNKSYEEVALHIIYPFVSEDIAESDLYEIIRETYKNFTDPKIAPLVNIDKNKYILELFYGPTLAFKDYGLQFLGNIFSHMMKNTEKKITVLGATSGDTGSAAINAFKGKSNINIFVLHPYNKISEVQRRQMTTVLEDNVFNIALEGSFDDCQKIVKDLFLNNEMQKKTSLAAVNSINWARLMAQTVYYFWAYLQLEERKVNFIVPSGNFGNIFSARVAQNMGLPIKELHIVTNKNETLNKIISSGQMEVSNVKNTYSPSMDIQISSNFERQIFESVAKDSDVVKDIMSSFNENNEFIFESGMVKEFKNTYISSAISNDTTLNTIKKFKENYNYLSDPHTATGLSVLDSIQNIDHPYVSLACAHPAKFGQAIEKATGISPSFPIELDNIFDKNEKMTILPNNPEVIKSLIIKNI